MKRMDQAIPTSSAFVDQIVIKPASRIRAATPAPGIHPPHVRLSPGRFRLPSPSHPVSAGGTGPRDRRPERTIRSGASAAVAGVLLWFAGTGASHGAGSNWMTPLDGNTRLSQLSIPGTHNSAARKENWPGTAKCQDLSIGDQLNAGIRYFDARCRHIGDSFSMHHGEVYQDMRFGEVLSPVYTFLAANPGECVMMSVKEEHTAEGNTRSFEATFDSYVAGNPSRWWLGTSVPTLAEARGKIVLVRRFGASVAKGINATYWPDNNSFNANNLAVEDHYVVDNNDTKWGQVTTALNAAAADTNAAVLHLTHASGYHPGVFGIPSIPDVSGSINPRLYSFFAAATMRAHYGCVLMDFADAARGQAIYNTNFVTPGPVADGVYRMLARHSGKAADVSGISTANGALIHQWSWHGGNNQRWRFTNLGGGYYTISALHSGKFLDVEGSSTANGGRVLQYQYTGNNNQIWQVIDNGDGSCRLANRNSGLVLDVYDAGSGDGVAIQQWSWGGGNNQRWTIQASNTAPGFTADPVAGQAVKDSPASGTLPATDADPADTQLTFTKQSGPAWLTVAANGTYSGTPTAANLGMNTFTVRATDSAGAYDEAVLTINVLPCPTWTNRAGGSWTGGENWYSGVIASGAGVTADFGTLDLTSDTTVTLDAARAVGHLTFGDTTPGHNWTLASGGGGPLTLQPGSGSPVINIVNQTTTIGAALAGTDGLTKSGAGTLVLAGTNTYTGTTQITAGTLRVGNGGTSGNLGGTAVVNQGILEFFRSDGSTVSQSVSGTGKIYVKPGGTLTFSGALSTGGVRFHESGSRTVILGGSAANTITMIEDAQDGHGTLVFAKPAGVNAFSGPVLDVGSGYASQFLVRLDNHNQIADATSVAMYGWDGGYGGRSWLQLNGFNETIAGLTGGSATSYVQNGAAGPSVLTLGGSGSYELRGAVNNGGTGTLSLVKSGAGTQTFSGDQIDYTGSTTVGAGRLVLLNNDDTWTSGITVSAGAVVEINRDASASYEHRNAFTLSGNGTLEKTGAGIADMNWDLGGTVAMGSGGLIRVKAGTLRLGYGALSAWTNNKADLTIDTGAVFDLWDNNNAGVFIDALNGGGGITRSSQGQTGALTVGVDGGSGDFQGVISNASGSTRLVKQGPGTQVLSGANTYSGGTTVHAGNIVPGTDTALGTGPVTLNGGSLSTGASRTIANSLIAASGGAIIHTAASNWQFTGGTLTGGGTLAVTGYAGGSSRQLFNGINTSGFTGTIAVTGRGVPGDGVYFHGGTTDIGSSVKLNIGAGGYVTVQLATANIGELGGTAANAVLTNEGGATNFVVGALNTDSSFAGGIRNSYWAGGSVGLTKTGSGKLTLGGANTYTGATAVSQGTLVLTGSLADTAVTVAAAGTLAGTGAAGGRVTCYGTLAPGADGIGNLTVANTLTLAGGSRVAWEISDWNGTAGTGFDKVAVTTLDLTATSANPVAIRPANPALVNFTESSKTFVLIQTTSGITGFSADKFIVDTTGLTVPRGTWSVRQSGNNLVLDYARFNAAPVFAANPFAKANATEDAAYSATMAGSASDSDSGETLTYSKISGPAWLSVAAGGTLTGTPANANAGPNSFIVRVTDSMGAYAEATLNITVINTNDAPVFTANPVSRPNATEDSAYSGTLAGSATDVDAGSTLTYAKVSGPAWLAISASGALSGTPANSHVGINSFTIRVSDGTATADTTLNITVINTNDAPVFAANPITGPSSTQDSAYSGTLAGSATDVDAGDTLTYAKVSGPAWLDIAANGALSGTPGSGDTGTQTFTVSADDGKTSATATLRIEVAAVDPDANANGILDAWEIARFGHAESGSNPADADPDRDGLCNLLEYALDTDPVRANPDPVIHDFHTLGDGLHLRLTVPINPAATNLVYTVETCDDLAGWSGRDTVVENQSAGELVVRDAIGCSAAARRFIRLKVAVRP